MEPIKSVLKEELNNSLRLKERYEEELRKLPKGVLVQKVIRGHPYYYLAAREGRKVKYFYKGKLDEKEIKKYEEIKRMRKNYRNLLSRVKGQIKFLKRALKDGRKTG